MAQYLFLLLGLIHHHCHPRPPIESLGTSTHRGRRSVSKSGFKKNRQTSNFGDPAYILVQFCEDSLDCFSRRAMEQAMRAGVPANAEVSAIYSIDSFSMARQVETFRHCF